MSFDAENGSILVSCPSHLYSDADKGIIWNNSQDLGSEAHHSQSSVVATLNLRRCEITQFALNKENMFRNSL